MTGVSPQDGGLVARRVVVVDWVVVQGQAVTDVSGLTHARHLRRPTVLAVATRGAGLTVTDVGSVGSSKKYHFVRYIIMFIILWHK